VNTDTLKTILGFVTDHYVAVSIGALVVAAGLRQTVKLSKKQGKVAQLRHARMETSAGKVLEKIRAMVPLKNPGPVFAYLRKMNPYAFEEMILHELEHRKLKIRRNAAYSGDGGIDGTFFLDDQKWLVQAKRYAKYVKKEHVWAFDAVCKEHKAKGLFVHTGKTPKDLLELKRQCGVVRII
jgi:restriction system protein